MSPAFSTYKAAVYLLLPLMWLNLTAGENHWEVFGLGLGQLLYWVIIILGWYVAWHTPYRLVATAMLILATGLRVLQVLDVSDLVEVLRVVALAFVFVIAGAKAYGEDPNFLHRQLVVFLALCVAIMVLQVLGVSQFVMTWSTGYAHDPELMLTEEIGTFREVPLYPTLFVGSEQLQFGIGQARPVGLMHSSNVLSIFVAVGVAVNLCIQRSSRLRLSDLVVTAAVVLTMSKMVFIIALLLYVASAVLGIPARRLLGLKLILALVIGVGIYYLLFPGLLLTNFSEEMIRTSFVLRLMGLVSAIGLNDMVTLLYDQQELIGSAFQEDEAYSGVALLFTSRIMLPALAVMAAMSFLYLYRIRKMKGWPVNLYMSVVFVCALTQFAVPFAAASSFQFIMGLGLLPLFGKLWPARMRQRTEVSSAVSVPVQSSGNQMTVP